MADLLHLNLTNGILPMLVLLALAVGVPAVLAHDTLSQLWLAGAILATALGLWLAGAAILALLYAAVNGGPTSGIGDHLRRSALFALLWGPVLLLVWLMRAQGVERRKGLLMKGEP